jgi:hypothetical protein
MPKIRPMAALLILLSSGFSILIGMLLDHASPSGTANYRAIYYGARCVIHREDPYRPDVFLRVYDRESGRYPSDPTKEQLFLRATAICVNLPTTLFLVTPLAQLPWSVSSGIWLVLIALSVTVAAFLAYDLAKDFAPRLALLLVCFMLANNQVLFVVGNTAGIAVSCCVIAVWCFIRRQGIWIGSLCLALSLALKPHDSGLLWAYLLVCGGALRKSALRTVLIFIVIALPSVLWISQVAPHWYQELRANLSTTSQRGDISDPGPTSISRAGSADVILSLQSVLSIFRDDPSFYNPTSILICAALFAFVSIVTIRSRAEPPHLWCGIAAVAALTMLPSYHRPYDARLLFLAIPATAMLWAEGGPVRRAVSSLSAAAIVLTADIPLSIVSLLARKVSLEGMSSITKLLLLPFIRPAPLVLLIVAIAYTVMFAWRSANARGLQPLSAGGHFANKSI